MKTRRGERRRERLRQGRRERLVAAVMAIAREAEPTVFAIEGPFRHGLRADLCLEGWEWAKADAAAADVVATALDRLGAERPTWLDGQPEVTGHTRRFYCANPRCKAPLGEGNGDGRNRLYCSELCRTRAKTLRYTSQRREWDAARQRAKRAQAAAAAPWATCAECGTAFKPVKSGKGVPIYCSRSCATTASNKKRAHPWRQIGNTSKHLQYSSVCT